MSNTNYEEQLYKLFANVNEWLKFAEAKNFGLLTLNGAIVFGFSQTNFENGSILPTIGFFVFSPFAVISFAFALLSLFPILTKIEKGTKGKNFISKFSNLISKEASFENIHYYGYLKDINETEFELKFLTKINATTPFTTFEKELASQILYNSRITWLKYQFFKIATFIFFLGVLAFFVGSIWMLIFK